MTTWTLILFSMGLFALVYNLFDSFRSLTPWWAMVIMIIAFGILVRIWQKEGDSEKERLVARIQELEEQLKL